MRKSTPQEMADQTPLGTDRRGAHPASGGQRWFAAKATTGCSMRGERFFSRNGIYLWWGGLDLKFDALQRKAHAPTDRGYLMNYDLDAELMNANFYPATIGADPRSFQLRSPKPEAGARSPAGALVAQLSEWILPYDRAARPTRRELRVSRYGVRCCTTPRLDRRPEPSTHRAMVSTKW